MMPFGLKNAGAIYQRLVSHMFHPQIGWNVEVYVDGFAGRGGNSCSRVGFVSCQVMSIRLHRSTLTRHVY